MQYNSIRKAWNAPPEFHLLKKRTHYTHLHSAFLNAVSFIIIYKFRKGTPLQKDGSKQSAVLKVKMK